MKTIILCGGQGTRLREETEFKPKPLVQIGGYPILFHIMKIYAYYGFKDFILALGYKGELIKDYFLNMAKYEDDFELNMKTEKVTHFDKKQKYDFNITFAETGLETNTGGRILQALEYVEDERFMVTYGDGVSDVNINTLIDFHMKLENDHGTYATVTTVHPSSKYGKIQFDKNNIVTLFEEKKPTLDDYINGGFQVFNKKSIEFIKENDMLEDALIRLTNAKKLAMYRYEGFWYCMDTQKQVNELNKLWEEGGKPWAVWEKNINDLQRN